MQFNGFEPQALQFLKDLDLNNNKEWFERRRDEYEALILIPLRKLVMDLSPTMIDIDPQLELRPVVNKTISRIYRDTRFSKDKRIFRNHMWIAFKHPRKDWHDTPSWWFEIMPQGYTYGMGFYQASPSTMENFRHALETDLSGFKHMIKFLPGTPPFRLEGSMYKRLIANDLPENMQSWYQRRNLYVICKRPEEEVLYSPHLVDLLSSRFQALAALYHFWMSVSAD
jgi:uncharacterized protein (TIGR02453 family)